MKIKITPKMRAKRILRHVSRFSFTDGQDELMGKMIGIYSNTPHLDSLFIYELGIKWTTENQQYRILYSSIEKITDLNKNYTGFLTLHLNNGEILPLPVRGQNGKFLDTFEFTRFLGNVIADIKEVANLKNHG